MADVTNLWPDPKAVSSDQTTILAHNYFYNPSPVGSYDGYLATGTATLSQPSGRSIKGAGGIRVTSPDASSGVALTLFEYDNRQDNTVAVYVRASSAMTITASITATGYTPAFQTKIGWGEFGWGETYTYTETASYTFAAGEVKRVRIGSYLNANPTGAAQHRFHLKGAGEFDIDGVMHVDYVTDGVDPASFPGGYWDIPNVPPYFDGDKTDTAHLMYSWDGTANASRSTQRGNRARYLQSREQAWNIGYNNCRTSALPGGETGVAVQAPWGTQDGSSAYALGYNVDLRSLGLEAGKHYVLSMDVVSLYENFIEGYPGHLYDSVYLNPGTGSTYPHPLRKRLHQPLTVGGTAITDNYLTVYRNWMTGESFFTDFSLFEVPFRAARWTPNGVAANLPLDLLAHGLVPGSSYRVQFEGYLDAASKFYRIEYQTAAGGSTWTTLYENVYDAAVESSYFGGDITVPAAATALRLTANTTSQLYFDFDVFSTPPAAFSGDTPDGGGYTYSWAGTPYQSASIRSEATGPTAQVFVGGTAKTVSEMRIVSGGSLVPVTEAG